MSQQFSPPSIRQYTAIRLHHLTPESTFQTIPVLGAFGDVLGGGVLQAGCIWVRKSKYKQVPQKMQKQCSWGVREMTTVHLIDRNKYLILAPNCWPPYAQLKMSLDSTQISSLDEQISRQMSQLRSLRRASPTVTAMGIAGQWMDLGRNYA